MPSLSNINETLIRNLSKEVILVQVWVDAVYHSVEVHCNMCLRCHVLCYHAHTSCPAGMDLGILKGCT